MIIIVNILYLKNSRANDSFASTEVFIKASSSIMTQVNTNESKTMADKNRKEIFEDFISNVTLHGIRFVFEESGIRRLLWIIIMFGATTLSVHLFYEMFQQYIKFATLTVLKTDFSIQEGKFPTVTFCNLNSVHHEKLRICL